MNTLSLKSIKPKMDTTWIKSLILLIVFTTVNAAAVTLHTCGHGDCRQGEYYSVSADACLPCPVGTYLDADYHNCSSCRLCIDDKAPGVVVKRPCNQTHNAIFTCAEGYFFKGLLGGRHECAPCTTCNSGQYVKFACKSAKDTVCDVNTDSGSRKMSEWLIPLLAVSIPATIFIIIFAILSVRKVSSIQRKFLCHRAMEEDEVSIVETYKHLQEERKEKRKKKKAKDKDKEKDKRDATPAVP